MPLKVEGQTRWFAPGSPRDMSEEELVTCTKCGGTWMELVSVRQYKKLHNVQLGQKPPAASDVGFWIFRCPKCGEVYEPTVSAYPRDLARRNYEGFVEHMIKPLPGAGEGPGSGEGEKV